LPVIKAISKSITGYVIIGSKDKHMSGMSHDQS
jgi:hypothetical protein